MEIEDEEENTLETSFSGESSSNNSSTALALSDPTMTFTREELGFVNLVRNSRLVIDHLSQILQFFLDLE